MVSCCRKIDKRVRNCEVGIKIGLNWKMGFANCIMHAGRTSPVIWNLGGIARECITIKGETWVHGIPGGDRGGDFIWPLGRGKVALLWDVEASITFFG